MTDNKSALTLIGLAALGTPGAAVQNTPTWSGNLMPKCSACTTIRPTIR